MEAKVKFKNPGVIININGQKIDHTNLTQENYDYLCAWNQSYADYFEPLEEKIQPIVKSKQDGKAKEGQQPDSN
jgi:hypothetical protein